MTEAGGARQNALINPIKVRFGAAIIVVDAYLWTDREVYVRVPEEARAKHKLLPPSCAFQRSAVLEGAPPEGDDGEAR